MAIVADRDMPAWQWSNTVEPFLRASSANRKKIDLIFALKFLKVLYDQQLVTVIIPDRNFL
jgi:hypothetical protein